MNKSIFLSLCIIGVVSISGCKADQPAKSIDSDTVISTIVSELSSSSQPTMQSEIEKTLGKNELIFDTHEYQYEVVTGATQTTFGSNPKPLYTYEEKLKKMFWSNQPPLGLMEGNYFSNQGLVDAGNTGIVEIVTDDNGKIVNVEYQEYTSKNYYSSEFAEVNKRLSHYAFFQAKNPRTDTTLATIVNGVTFVEKQMREENRVAGNFNTVKGSSTSAREGVMAIAAELNDVIRKTSDTKYLGYAEKFDDGITGRLQLTLKNGKIDTVRYDEYFSDAPEQMKDPKLQPYYRQSKYFSLEYNKATENNFKKFSDQLVQTILETQSLKIENENLSNHPSFETYLKLAEKIEME
ncbi:hypothetical protein [Enterococcus rivorum]|uniref:Lipoprotein n=1 Tax=Enterococcus rivorum TaxID=762845 RepID=A0A1E5KT20_9ENTE|nr:hypothetical protein [Enterococcus rivorum]MBP2098097.1 major membrane immunogen (membrane-anchored lipoprotein) [Enterococcus rivorum]OEH81035.1 hypothetical protein BCR26_05865 [Enterococcus rivorum]